MKSFGRTQLFVDDVSLNGRYGRGRLCRITQANDAHQMGAGTRQRRVFFSCDCSVICFFPPHSGFCSVHMLYWFCMEVLIDLCLVLIDWTVTMHLACR